MASQKKHNKRKSIQNSDPGKILDLVMHLNEDNYAQMQLLINQYLQDEFEAELVLQIIVHGERMEAFIEVVGQHVLPRKQKIKMSEIFCDVMKSGHERIDLFSYLPSDFKEVIALYSAKDNPKKRMIMSPVTDKPFSVIVCILSPKIPEEHVAIIIHECFLFCWPTIKKTIALEYECTLKQKCQHLLRVARRLFTEVASLKTLLRIAMDQARHLTRAEYSSVMLVDVEKMELYESYYTAREKKEKVERRFPMNIGIVGQVLNSGVLANVKSVSEHPNYDPTIDGHDGVDAKTILCFPIREQTGIIGVGQLINKIGDPYFDAMDEELALSFSVYCGICIVHSVIYEKMQEAHIRNALANELVMYHMKVTDTEINNLLHCSGFHEHPHIVSLHFNIRALPMRELQCYVFKMFFDLGFDKKFQIRKTKLARFILQTKKGYRDVPYHNWLHAFGVVQWAYAAMMNYKLLSNGYISDLQGLMYLVAAIVHDIDHRGTTNTFQIQGQTTLAALYSSEGSVMERHHLAQAICILNTEGSDILENLPRRDYDRALMLLKDYVLATDLATYFKNLNDFKAISMDYQKGNRLHTAALQSLLMTAADLSDQLKDWSCIKKTAAAVLTEFFNQGDEEKNRGDLPAIIMDRDKCVIPDLEIQFINGVCIPLYSILGNIIPRATLCLKILENHAEKWESAKPIFAEVPVMAGLSVLLSPDLDNLIEQSIRDREKRLEEGEEVTEEED